MFDQQGKPRCSVGQLPDITDRKQNEDKLRLTNKRFQVALKQSDVVIFNQDLNLRYTYFHNPTFGGKAEDILGKHDVDLFERMEDAQAIEAIKRSMIGTGESRHAEVLVKHRGDDYFLDLRVDPSYSASGKISGITCTAIDVTERKRIETALKEDDHRKDEFLATLAHELRNPLAPLRNGLQVMDLVSHDAAVLGEIRTMMQRQRAQLVRVVDDLLDVSRISQGRKLSFPISILISCQPTI